VAPVNPPSFEAFAEHYDHYTAGYQAVAWTGKLEALLLEQGLRGDRLLDVGCGTGKSFIPMRDRGWNVVGCDLSPAMLEIAREKVGPEVRLEVADVRGLPKFGDFDLVWALNDTLNNVLGTEELQAALQGMKRNLAATGMLLFDLNTLALHQAIHAPGVSHRDEGSRTMVWTGLATGKIESGSTCEARFEVDGDPNATHIHRQRHFPEAEVLKAIEASGLECLEVWGDYEGEQDQPLDEGRHQKAIYVVQ
jgi:SAM-dependent methyltransferase